MSSTFVIRKSANCLAKASTITCTSAGCSNTVYIDYVDGGYEQLKQITPIPWTQVRGWERWLCHEHHPMPLPEPEPEPEPERSELITVQDVKKFFPRGSTCQYCGAWVLGDVRYRHIRWHRSIGPEMT